MARILTSVSDGIARRSGIASVVIKNDKPLGHRG